MLWFNSGAINEKFWNIKCTVKNFLEKDKNIITNKCNLYENMKLKYPQIATKHLPRTQKLNDFVFQKGKVYIVRPCGRGFYSGQGIYVISNEEQLQKVKQIYNQTYIRNRQDVVGRKNQTFDVIVSEYIVNPLLLNGFKFHIRMYLLINLFPSYSHKLFDIGKIITAKEEYKQSDFENKDIHDTHMKSTSKNMFFPHDLCCVDIEKIMIQMIRITDSVSDMFEEYAKSYPESKTAFELFGLDFMVDSSLNVFLIELNDRVGYAPAQNIMDESFKNFINKYYNWIYKNAIEPVFKD
jgi:hypothetical protein